LLKILGILHFLAVMITADDPRVGGIDEVRDGQHFDHVTVVAVVEEHRSISRSYGSGQCTRGQAMTALRPGPATGYPANGGSSRPRRRGRQASARFRRARGCTLPAGTPCRRTPTDTGRDAPGSSIAQHAR